MNNLGFLSIQFRILYENEYLNKQNSKVNIHKNMKQIKSNQLAA